jgi:hypothetical protein
MATVAMSGSDTVMINNRIFADLADGNCVELTYPNDVASVKTGKNGNSIYGLNETGKQAEVKIRLIRGSSDDKFMNSLFAQQQGNFAGFPLMLGQFIKKIGDGAGNVSSDTYIMGGGIFTKAMEAKMNVEGESEQSVVVYTMKFSNAPRVIT